MNRQNPASSVSRYLFSIFYLLISRQSLVSVAGCLFKRVAGSGKVFGLNTLKQV